MNAKTFRLASVIFLIALIWRALFLRDWFASPLGEAPFLDAKSYWDWAQALASGQSYGPSVFYQSPLYPYLLAPLIRFFGLNLFGLSLLQIILSSLSSVLLALVALDLFGMAAAWCAGVLAAGDAVLIFYSAPVLKETVGFFFLCLLLWSLIRFYRKPSLCWSLALGVFLGSTVMIRSNAILFLPALAGAWLLQFRNQASRWTLAAAVGVLVPIVPFAWHNLQAGDSVLLTSSGGFNFYIGNSPSATGSNHYPDDVSTDPAFEWKDTARIAEQQMGKSLKPSEVSHFWFQKGVEFLSHNLSKAGSLYLNKALFLVTNREMPDNYDGDFFARNFSPALRSAPIGFGLVFAFAILGVFLSPKKNPAEHALVGLALVYTASVVLFYVTDRYRMPLLALMIPFAGYGASAFWEKLKARQSRELTLSLAILLVPLMISLYPVEVDSKALEAQGWATTASAFADRKNLKDAEAALKHVRENDPAAAGSECFIKVALLLEESHRNAEAEALYQEALHLFPHDGLLAHNYGAFKLAIKDVPAAQRYFEAAIAINPSLVQPWIGLAVLKLQTSDRGGAWNAVQSGLKVDPTNSQLGELKSQLGPK